MTPACSTSLLSASVMGYGGWTSPPPPCVPNDPPLATRLSPLVLLLLVPFSL